VTQRRTRLALLLACTIASASVSADSHGQDCIDGKGVAAVGACRTLAERLSADKKRLQALGQSLEAAGRHGAATAVYETAGRFYPKDRVLLQGLIRARGNLRSMRLVSGPADRSSEQDAAAQSDAAHKKSPCWTLEWTDALTACESERRANPSDADLQERTGDLLRSMGRVGEALAAYLRTDRPRTRTRRVFVRMKAPHAGFAGPSTVSTIVRRALKRADLHPPTKGAHLLRHSLATGMLHGGASMAEIGEVLRHRSPNTTEIYAKVDLSGLRSLAQPWPNIGGAR